MGEGQKEKIKEFPKLLLILNFGFVSCENEKKSILTDCNVRLPPMATTPMATIFIKLFCK